MILSSDRIGLSSEEMNIQTTGLYLLQAKTDYKVFSPVSIVKID